jgi:hypothetical protein
MATPPKQSKQSVRTREIKGNEYRNPGTKTVTKSKTVGSDGKMTKTRQVVRATDRTYNAGSHAGAKGKTTSVKTKTKEKNVGDRKSKAVTKSLQTRYDTKGGVGNIDTSLTNSSVKKRLSSPGMKTKVKESSSILRSGSHYHDFNKKK